MSDPPRWEPPVPPGPPVAPPSTPEKPVFGPPPPVSQTPAPPPELPLASWGARAVAYLIDWLVAVVGVAALAFFLAWAISGDAGTAGIVSAMTYGVCEYLVRGIFYAPLLMRRPGARNGQTLGKQAIGIRVVRENAEPMDYGSALVRQWLVITVLLQVVGGSLTGGIAPLIDYLWPLWDSRNRAVHDIVASTMVFRVG